MGFLHRLLFVALGSLMIAAAEVQVKPILISCGSNSSINVDGREWSGDSFPGQNFTLNASGISASTAMIDGEPIYASLYGTARIFDVPSNYYFSVLPGSYYIRFHFCSFSFRNYNANESMFDVTANNFILVSKFNIPAEIDWNNRRSNSNATSMVKEYFVHVSASNGLKIEFGPTSGSFAFINAIEVVPVLQMFGETANKVGSKGLKGSVVLADRGVETMYRLNVGGPVIKTSQDQDLWRTWSSDEVYMFSSKAAKGISNDSNISYTSVNESYAAPLEVYETAKTMIDNSVLEKIFNMSWKFDVDPNFEYLIRLHFCELAYDKPNQRIFRVYINNKTAAENYDVFVRAGGKNKAYHEDYVEAIPEQLGTLWIQLGPESATSALGTDALLNGLEIFKLSRNGNLAYSPDRISANQGSLPTAKPKNKFLWPGLGAAVGTIITISLLCAAFICYRIRRKKSAPQEKGSPVWRPLPLHGGLGSTTNARSILSPPNANGSSASKRIGRRFTIAEIKSATKNFDESLVIGTGGFGKVYKGMIEEGNTVAIKRANPQSEQGLKEFETEIEMLSKLRHRHLVSMIGYCDEKNEMILVYEYMANGTLRSHLFGSDLPPLTWKQRLEACIGAARGLHYLHTGAERGIIHRDVKTTNILLDENFVAKMADFGLSKDGPALDHTHVSTAVKGSFGYLDPEYFRRQQLTEKSDVYSFGVVLFEVLCARPVINPSLPREQINIAEWALHWQRRHMLETIVDPRLEGGYSSESLKKFGEIAEKCLADEGKNRPTMGDVLWHLEYVLQLHEADMRKRDLSSARDDVNFAEMSFSLPRINEGEGEEEEEAHTKQESADEDTKNKDSGSH